MNRKYDEIMEVIGADEFKELIKKWEILSANIKNNSKKLPFILPDLLCIGNSGIGRTKMLTMMADYLAEKGNLMEFHGDTRYLEFLLAYVPKNAPFHELQRLEEELAAARGFRSEFNGIVLFDIDPWVDHYKDLYFASFMEYLAAHSDDWLIVLSVSELPAEKLRELEAFLSMYLRLDKLTLTLPKTEDLYRFVEQNLREYELGLEHTSRELLMKTLDELRNSPYFDGFKTIKMLCQEIVYEHFSTPNATPRTLTADDLAGFAPTSNYVKKAIDSSKKKHRIGYVHGEE